MNLLIDVDGTLIDSRQGIIACLQHALASVGRRVPEPDEVARLIGPPIQVVLREWFAGEDSGMSRAIEAYRARYAAVGMFESTMYEGIPQALTKLQARGGRLFVVTSKPTLYARRMLDHFGLTEHFAQIQGSELDGRLVDKGELIAHVLASCRLRPEQTCMVGDRYHDAVGATANGVSPVGVLWGYGSRQELVDAGVSRLMASPQELAAMSIIGSAAVPAP